MKNLLSAIAIIAIGSSSYASNPATSKSVDPYEKFNTCIETILKSPRFLDETAPGCNYAITVLKKNTNKVLDSITHSGYENTKDCAAMRDREIAYFEDHYPGADIVVK